MSTTIDSKVVEMRFDNKHFESNVSTTMSTLDKLKQALHLDGASKGLENVGSAVKKVDFAPLSTAAETVQAKFSAMEVMAVTALANITNSAVNAGKRMVSALTIDPVKTGLSEYETQINSTQTILANVKHKGKTLDDVNVALEELNKYADQTIYNFTEMTKNIGLFTNAGVDLDRSVASIKGFSNAAAMAGADATTTSRAMYQLSQAMSSGAVKLTDWRSLEQANITGERFQETLKITARVHDVAIDDMIKKEGNLRETLKSGWLTADIMAEALNHYTLSTETMSKAEQEAARTKMLANGYTEEQVKLLFELGTEATSAATKVKTFSQMWDVLKESAQSGWSATWKLIIGDFEEARNLLTPLTETLTGFIGKMSDFRNRILQIALDFATPWMAIEEKISKITGKVDKVVSGVTGTLEYFQDVVDKVWMGVFNNWGDNPDRRDLLKAAGYDHRVVQYLVDLGEESWNSGKVYKLSMEEVEAAHKKYGLTVKTTKEETEEVTEAFNGLSDEMLESAGLTEDEIRLYRALEKEANKLGISVSELAEDMSKNNGRDLLIKSFKNIGRAIMQVADICKTAYVEIFNPPSVEEIGIGLYGLIRRFKDFTDSLTLVDKKTKKLTANGEKVKDIFKGVFALIDIIVTLSAGPLRIVFNVLTQLLGIFGYTLFDAAAALGRLIVKFRDGFDGVVNFTKIIEKMAPYIKAAAEAIRDWAIAIDLKGKLKTFAEYVGKAALAVWDWIDGLNIISGIYEKIITPISNAINSFKAWIETLKKSENLPQDIAKGIVSGFSKAYHAVVNFFKNLPTYISNGFKDVGNSINESPVMAFVKKIAGGFKVAGQVIVEIGKMLLAKVNEFLSEKGFKTISEDSIAGLVNGLKEGAIKVWNAGVAIVTDLVQKVKEFLGIHSPSTVFAAIGGFIVAGLIAGLQNGIPDSLGAVKDLFQPMLDWINGLDFGAIFAAVMGTGTLVVMKKFADGFKDFASMFKGAGSVCESVAEVIKKSRKSINEVIEQTAGVMKAFKKEIKADAFKTRTEGIKNLGIALLMLVGAIIVLTFFDTKKLWMAVGIIAALAVILGLLVWWTSKISESSLSLSKEGGLNMQGFSTLILQIGIAILMIGAMMKIVGAMQPDELNRGLQGLTAAMIAIIGITFLMSKIVDGSSPASIAAIGPMMLKISAAFLIMAAATKILGKMDQTQLIQGGLAILAFSGIIAGLMLLTKLIGGSGRAIASIGSMMLQISAAFVLMAVAVKMLGKMDRGHLIQGGLAILAFSGIIAGLMLVTKLIGGNSKSISAFGGMMLKVSATFLIMAYSVKTLGRMKKDELERGYAAIEAFALIIVGLMAATRLVGGKNKVKSIGTTILAISAAIAIMALTAIICGLVPADRFKAGMQAVLGLSGIIVGLMAATRLAGGKKAKQIGSTLIMISAAIGILALVAILLSMVKPENLERGISAVTQLGIVMAGLIAVTKLAQKCLGNLIVLTVAIAVLAASVYLLSTVDQSALAGATDAMTAVLGMFAVVIAATGVAGKAIGTILAITVAIAAIGGVLYLLAQTNPKSAIAAAIALDLLLVVITGVLFAMIPIGKFAMDAIKGVIALTAIAVPLLAFAAILLLMNNVKNAITNATALIMLATVMTLLLIPLTLVGAFGYLPFIGVLALLAMAVPLIAFVGILALMSNISNAEANAAILTGLMTTMAAVLLQVALVAPLAVVAVTVLTMLTGLVGTMAILLTALGALSQIPGFNDIIADGGVVLGMIGFAIGNFVGQLAAGLIGGVASSLPVLGLCLSQFMVNATPFILGVKMVDQSVLAGVGILTAAVLALSAADFISGILSFLSGGISFAMLGTELSMFMLNAMPFILGASMISGEMMAGVKALADTILVLTAANVLEGLTSWLTGGSSLETFAAQLPILGTALAGFRDNIGTFTDAEMTTVTCAANAIKTLASAAAEIPNTGGLLADIVGDNQLGPFAAQFPILGTGLRDFLTNVGTFTDEQVATVDCAAQAIKALAQASSEIPNSGGWLGQIVGNNDLGTFAAQFPILGTGLAGFLTNVGTFTDEQVATVECAASAIKSLAEASSQIPNSGGWLGQIVGENNLGTFADQFPKLGSGLAGFLTNVGTFTDEQVATVNCAAQSIKALADASSRISNSGGWIAKLVGDNDLGTFASNFPSVGKGLKGFVDELGSFTTAQVATVGSGVAAIDALSGLASVDLKGAKKNISGFGDKLPGFAKDVKTFCDAMPGAVLMNSATTNLKTLLAATVDIDNVNSGAFSTLAKNLKKVGEDAVKKFVGAFTSSSAKTDVKEAAKTLAAQAPEGAKTKATGKKGSMESAGKDLGSGLVSGINAKQTAVYNAGHALGQKAVQGEKDGQKSNSPSKLTIQAGKWIGEGLIIGMDNMGRSVYKAGSTLGSTATKTISNSISQIANMVSTDIDTQPTIRPVLDLSDVRSGASALSGMLDMNSSVGVQANIGAISSMMNLRGQNGANDDVVAALDSLNKKMDNIGNTTYNLNGMTYDDGSNIATAMTTIARAALKERRM